MHFEKKQTNKQKNLHVPLLNCNPASHVSASRRFAHPVLGRFLSSSPGNLKLQITEAYFFPQNLAKFRLQF